MNVRVGLTIAAWIRIDAGAGSHRDLVSKDGEGYVNAVGSDFERQYLLTVSNLDRLRPHVGTPSGFKVLDGNAVLPSGVWQKVAMTYDADSGDLVLYLNGSVDAQMVVPAGDRCIVDTPQPLRVGGSAPAQCDQLPFTGLLDEVRIYDRALSGAEVAAL